MVERKETTFARQRLGKHTPLATDTHAAIEEPSEVSHWSGIMSCEAVASRQGREHECRGIYIVESPCLATASKDYNTLRA
jgi:hypothetical protein